MLGVVGVCHRLAGGGVTLCVGGVLDSDAVNWLGSYGGCATHDPIPNSIVKPPSADDTSA